MAAEAVGLAASVAGLLSLGLRVTNGLVTYLDAIKNRGEELSSVRRQNDVLSRSQNRQYDPAIVRSIQSCETELQAVEELLAGLANCDTITWRERLCNKKKKLSYAFDRAKVQQVTQRLHHANNILQLALTGLGLDSLTAIDTSSREHASNLLLLRSEVAAAATSITDARDQVPALQSRIDSAAELTRSHSTIAANQVRESRQAIQEDVRLSHDALELKFQEHLEKLERIVKLQQMTFLALRSAKKPAVLMDLCDSARASKQATRGTLLFEIPDQKENNALGYIPRPSICFNNRKVLHLPPTLSIGDKERSAMGRSQSLPRAGNPGTLAKFTNTKTRRAINFKYKGLASILQSVVEISFAKTSGAGGFSSSPSFTYRPTVNKRTDPAFRILYLLQQLYGRVGGQTRGEFTIACMRRLVRLFDNRKACPTAVTERGVSLMHEAAHSVRAKVSKLRRRTLITNQVMVAAYHCGWDIGEESLFVDLIKTLLRYGVVAISYDDEACECGPLSMAVIRKDANEVVRILNRYPGSISEVDIHGQSPLHLAAAKPRILAMLVKAADSSVLNQVDHAGTTALEAAMVLSSGQCINGASSKRCQRCGCIQCVELLLEAGSNVRMRRQLSANSNPGLDDILAPASELARRRYVFHMRQLRTDRPLQWSTCNRLPRTPEFGQIPSSCSVDKPTPSLSRVFNVQTNHSKDPGTEDYHWIYEEIDAPVLADLFYRHGFQPDGKFFIRSRSTPLLMRWDKAYNYVSWLAEHGQTLSFDHEVSDIGIYGAHYAYFNVGKRMTDKLQSGPLSFDKLSATVMRRSLSDGHECHCSRGGCSPLTWMMKGALASFIFPPEFAPSVYKRLMVRYYAKCSPELALLTYETAIRYMTFQVLGLVHTCCKLRDSIWYTIPEVIWCEREGAIIVNEEQSSLIKLHEELVSEFMTVAPRFLKDETDRGFGANTGKCGLAKSWTNSKGTT
ncbi:hypothetical protein PG994_014070 [Apiospora phragmitis]|uniref:Uncharacterized protein n=1 Tax=Apiospora phragmitis TaxID=2905665 RepID=A0ABR1T3A2_9PEZI